ncbi:hypothetical protein LVY72_02275 [Arthrobacter sp. I2-34]|uniref:Uncharacterized protein n=1 Tax=Arthrobacter hankyongi TaxID=2904801 RepID=A0ABS9L229_9MICC|nr:hypothetical protein [Arthrobacter hankyongi]MCG2620734.1 hypothetical protein [Arthrobacter hankyongi]
MVYYPLWIRFQGRRLALVWQIGDGEGPVDQKDAVVVEQGTVASAGTAAELQALGLRLGISLEDDDDDLWELDGLEDLLELPPSEEICTRLLNAWNLYDDVARSVDCSLDDRSAIARTCYDKLFFGNNLDSITPAGTQFRPAFNDAEKDAVREILHRGRIILAGQLRPRRA